MTYPKQWPNKTPAERFVNGAIWSALLDGATIASVSATVLSGDVSLAWPGPSWIEGDVQKVGVSGGTLGTRQRVRCTATLSDGRIYAQDFDFKVW